MLAGVTLGLFMKPAIDTPAETIEPVQREFLIKDLKTESGVVLPEARIT